MKIKNDPWPAIRSKELSINQTVFRIEEAGPNLDDNVLEGLYKEIAEFSKMLKRTLDLYSTIDYVKQREEKIQFKAKLKYSYRLLDLLTKIVRLFEASKVITAELQMYFGFIDDQITARTESLESRYYEAAKTELESFHDQSFRDKLSSHLAGSFNRVNPKFNSGDSK